MGRIISTQQEELKDHIRWLRGYAWAERREIVAEQRKRNWPKRFYSPAYSKYRWMRLEIGWLEAIAREG